MHLDCTAPEEWRPIPGWAGLYEASTYGRIRRLNRDPKVRPFKILKLQRQWHGYQLVGMSKDNVSKTFAVHVIVAAAFIGPRPDGLEINHIDGDKTNNRPGNLEYVTRRENLAHADTRGLTRRGILNGKAKLTEDDVRAIRASAETQATLARRYGVVQGIISSVKLRRTWKHVV